MPPQHALKTNGNNAPHHPSCRHSVAACVSDHSRGCERIPLRHRSNPQRKKTVVIPEFSAWLTLVLERCRAENIRNLPRQRAPTPLFPERRPREACSMPISGCHDLPLATFNLPSRVFRHGWRRAGCLERRWGGFFHTLSRGQDLPPAIALRTNEKAPPPRHRSNPQRKTKTNPPRLPRRRAGCHPLPSV